VEENGVGEVDDGRSKSWRQRKAQIQKKETEGEIS